MMNLLFEGEVTSNEEIKAEMIKDLYLANPFKKGDEKLKLKPIKKIILLFKNYSAIQMSLLCHQI